MSDARRNVRRNTKSKFAIVITEEAGSGENARKEPTRNGASAVTGVDTKTGANSSPV